MGVQGLWELLAPVGRRVSVETIAGKKLAIDASIWMIQFMKAMRDEKGEMVKNAHLLGFFRRICKLLFLRTKPVFVFDGGTPALKRRTVVARRRQRENAQAKIRKTAEKLLLNHLKARKLEELANDIKIMKDKDDSTGRKVALESHDLTGNRPERNKKIEGAQTQESVDELLAASIAAEEERKFADNASTPLEIPFEKEDNENEDEEMVLPLMLSNVDPSVLASLPPSMQLDLLVQMRERLMAENRQKYQKVKKVPAKFSELQIQAYLKTVAFRREIDEVQKSAAGRGVGGMQTSRIASEANREFIFSSSFTGNKQMLTSAGVEKSEGTQHQVKATSKSADSSSSTCGFLSATGNLSDEARNDFGKDIATYIDERGRFRVNRSRGLGIRMTRDLQWNLDLIKEIELEKLQQDTRVNAEDPEDSSRTAENSDFIEVSAGNVNDEINLIGRRDREAVQGGNTLQEPFMEAGKTAMEISFEDDKELNHTDDDDLFSHLVSGSSVSKYSLGSSLSLKNSNESRPEFSVEKEMLRKCEIVNIGLENSQQSFVNDSSSDGGDIDWEEGICDVLPVASSVTKDAKIASRGSLEEEADFQEAVRRSLEDFTVEKSVCGIVGEGVVSVGISMGDPEKGSELAREALALERDGTDSLDLLNSKSLSIPRTVNGVDRPETLIQDDTLQTNGSPGKHLGSSVRMDADTNHVYQHDSASVHHEFVQDRTFSVETDSQGINELKIREVQTVSEENCLNNFEGQNEEAGILVYADGSHKISTHIADACDGVKSNLPEVSIVANANNSGTPPSISLANTNINSNFHEVTFKEQIVNNVIEQNFVNNKNCDMPSSEAQEYKEETLSQSGMMHHFDAPRASLEEEMLLLRQERLDLGDEQRKLERNAESVSSEMFAECQELLQMFGLPYIIAPMEAEAQCAFLELENLVDGVVTDDSDVFLFGARNVYKNIFDDRKYVETYSMKDIETELGLNREKLIRMALLLGSDYTEGVSGIGIVNAIEVVNAFPEEDGLHKFREWIESPDPSILGKLSAHTGHSSKKRRLKKCSDNTDVSANIIDDESESAFRGLDDQLTLDGLKDVKQIFMDKHRNVSKNWHIPSSFPSEKVISAYTSPQVDKSTEPFSWGKPDLFVLRKLCWERFAWSNQKADELLIPVLKEYNKHETQLRLEAFYTFNERFAKIRSKRIKKAVKGIAGNLASELIDVPKTDDCGFTSKTKASPCATESKNSEIPSDGMNDTNSGNEINARRNIKKRSTKRGIESEATEVESGNLVAQDGSNKSTKNGRGRRRAGKQRRAAQCEEATEAISDDGANDYVEKQMQSEGVRVQTDLRRSARQRKQVRYSEDVDKSIDSPSGHSEGDYDASEKEPFSDMGVASSVHVLSDDNQTTAPETQESNLSGDYLSLGGGFCVDEDDADRNGCQIQHASCSTGPSGENQVIKPSQAADSLSRDHFSGGGGGGGFCADEEGSQNANPFHLVGSPSRASAGRTDSSALQQEQNTLDHEQRECGTTPHTQLIEERDSSDKLGLRALPSLRRRRKS